jgi:release factor glutamine methyltransferase
MTLQQALIQGTKLLEEGGIAAPQLTAEVLLCHALHGERSFLYAHGERELYQVEWIHYGRYLHERLNGKPTQYITGRQEFYGRDFRVTPDVLIPRPETELVVETVLKLARDIQRLVDVGCGSGAIAVTLACEMQAQIWGTDISAAALSVAADNARRLGARVEFIQCDLLLAIASRSVDVIASNPPYVAFGDRAGLQREVREYEPEAALFAGSTGFEIYERLVDDARRVLRRDGWLVVELGYNGRERVAKMLGPDWHNVHVEADLAGIPRVLAAQWEP